MELQDYLRIFRQYWLGIVLIVGAVTLAALGYSLLQPKVYAANANGFVTTADNSDIAMASVNDSLSRSRAKSYADIAKSRAIAENVVAQLGVDVSASSLVSRISVSQPIDTVLIKITARGNTPAEARDLADAWVAALAEEIVNIESGAGELAPGMPRVVPAEQAELPSAPISPNIPRNVLLGLIVGCMLAAGYAVLRSTLDRRLRLEEQIQQTFDIPVVGSVPKSKALQEELAGADIEADPAAGEALRKLRTNLSYMDVDDPPRILVITSPQPGDGKSTIAINLARTLVMRDEAVVLIDADLRRPTLADRLGLDPAVGLTSVLTGQLLAEDALQEVKSTPGLYALASGPLPPNPSELLSSKAWQKLIDELSIHAMLIIDAPPILPVTDAALLTLEADGAFIVVTHNKTTDEDLRISLQTLDTVGARALGVILNRVSARSTGYGGYGYAPLEQDRRATGKRAGRAEAEHTIAALERHPGRRRAE